MNVSRYKIIIGAVLILVLLPFLLYLTGAVYYVTEMESAVVTRFGEVQYAVVTGFHSGKEERDEQVQKLKEKYPGKIETEAGLYFKVPFIDKAHYFDSRILHWSGDVKTISTMDLRTLTVDAGAFWRIRDVIKFYESLGSRLQAENRLAGVINSQIEDEISKTRLIEVVRNQNMELEERVKKRLETIGKREEDEEEGQVEEPEAAKIRYGRKELIGKIKEQLAPELRQRFGIKIVDILITQLNYTPEVRTNVYDRMISERERIAERYRAQGKRTKREILGEVQRRKETMLSEADRRVKQILGEAEGKKIKIHADAFRRNPSFYKYQRTLETYRESLGENAIFLLSDDNELLRFVTTDTARPPEDQSDAAED